MHASATQMTLCIPVYNAMPYLADTLDSVLKQTFRDFKILVIDDGSTDGSLAYLQSVSDPRLTVIHQPNAGLTATLNRMLEMVKSGWLVRQDADDIALPNRMQRLHEYIQRYPQAGMVYSHAAHYQQGSLKGLLLTTCPDETGLRAFLAKGFLPSICHPSVALRVEAARAIGGYRFNFHVEDYDLYWRIGLEYDVAMIPEVLLGYRMVGSSVSGQNQHRQATNILYIQYLLLSELKKRPSLPYSTTFPVLDRMVDRGHLNFRSQMRSAMLAYSRRSFGQLFRSLTLAFLASPSSFVTRVLLRKGKQTGVGIAPSRFEAHASALWPASQG